jgi:hypothetical protein
MPMLSDEEVEDIRRCLAAGFRGPWLIGAVERLLADHDARKAAGGPAPAGGEAPAVPAVDVGGPRSPQKAR